MQDANDFLMSGGVKSAKFEKAGAVVKGTIARKPELQDQRDFDSGKTLTWEDGSPRKQVKVVIATGEKDDDDDNGERALYLKGNMLKAVQAAIKAADAKGLEPGGKLVVKYVKDGERKGKLNPPKLYQAKYEAPDPATVAAASEAGKDNAAEAAGDDDLSF